MFAQLLLDVADEEQAGDATDSIDIVQSIVKVPELSVNVAALFIRYSFLAGVYLADIGLKIKDGVDIVECVMGGSRQQQMRDTADKLLADIE